MKDSRIGAIGLLAVLSILSVQIGSLLKLEEFTPIALSIALFFGRFSSLWAKNFFPYLHEKDIIDPQRKNLKCNENSRFNNFQNQFLHSTLAHYIS